MRRRVEAVGQLELPLFDGDDDQGDESEWDSADLNAYQDAQSSRLPSGGDSNIRWGQIE